MATDQNYSQSPIPFNKRISSVSLIFIMMGFSMFSSSMLAGGKIGIGLNFGNFVLAILFGSAFLAIYAGILASIGAKTGLNTNLMYQAAFGTFGSKIPSSILAVTQAGWFGVGLAMLAITISLHTGINVKLLIVLGGIAMASNVFFGIKGLTFISAVAVPGIVILGSYSIYRAIDTMGSFKAITEFIPKPEKTIDLFSAISIVIGNFICGATVSADFARYGKKVFISVLACVLAFFFGNILMFVFGAFGTISTGVSDISDVMFKQGWILPGIIVLTMNIWTTNDNTLYVTGLSISNVTGLPSKICSMISALIGVLTGLWMYHNFVQFLLILSSIISPVGGVIIADYLLNKRKYNYFADFKKSFNPLAFMALITGILSSHFIPGIKPVNGVFAGFFSFIGFNYCLVLKKNMEKTGKKIQ